jgi:succinate dehydrogenase / fumarate reductase cytochrome b subunit
MAAQVEAVRPLSANPLVRLYQSSIGKKYIVAITGFLLFGFVVIHLLGNLQYFLGADKLNGYAQMLKANAGVLWLARLGLLGIVLLHIITAVKLWQENKAARPVKYGTGKAPVAASFASRTLIISGLIVLAFIVFHLAHFTMGLVDPELLRLSETANGVERHDVFRMVSAGFANPLISIFYIVAMGLLCLHLSHGVSSMFQSLGLKNHRWDKTFDLLAKTAAAVIFLGNCAIVIAAWLGIVK